MLNTGAKVGVDEKISKKFEAARWWAEKGRVDCAYDEISKVRSLVKDGGFELSKEQEAEIKKIDALLRVPKDKYIDNLLKEARSFASEGGGFLAKGAAIARSLEIIEGAGAKLTKKQKEKIEEIRELLETARVEEASPFGNMEFRGRLQ